MREPTLLILTALASGSPARLGDHGRCRKDLRRLWLRPGTLYAALNRLVVENLVEIDREEIVDTRLRRYYRLTQHGTQR